MAFIGSVVTAPIELVVPYPINIFECTSKLEFNKTLREMIRLRGITLVSEDETRRTLVWGAQRFNLHRQVIPALSQEGYIRDNETVGIHFSCDIRNNITNIMATGGMGKDNEDHFFRLFYGEIKIETNNIEYYYDDGERNPKWEHKRL